MLCYIRTKGVTVLRATARARAREWLNNYSYNSFLEDYCQ